MPGTVYTLQTNYIPKSMLYNLIPLQSAGAQAGGSGVVNILMIVALIAIFYLFMIRPQQKRQKEIRKFREGLGAGSKVLTAGGIHGKIKQVKDTSYVVEIATGVAITIDKNSVYPLGTEQADKPEPGVDKQ